MRVGDARYIVAVNVAMNEDDFNDDYYVVDTFENTKYDSQALAKQIAYERNCEEWDGIEEYRRMIGGKHDG